MKVSDYIKSLENYPMPNIYENITPERFDTSYEDYEGEPQRCEADHVDGGVCLTRLLPSGDCPRPERHK